MFILATGDWHIHNYPQFAKPWCEGLNTRVRDIVDALAVIPKLISQFRIKVFCHMGDWNMNASNDYRIVNVTREASLGCSNAVWLQGGCFIGIHGNHDTVSAAGNNHNNYPYMDEQILPELHGLKFYKSRVAELDDVKFYLVGYNDPLPNIPSLDTDAKFSVFLLHKDLEGGRAAQGFVYKADQAVGQMYFNAVKKTLGGRVAFLAGHYHHPQRVGDVEVVGSPVQHNRGDIGDQRGVLILDTDTGAVRRILVNGPRFHDARWEGAGALRFVCPCCAEPRDYSEIDYITVTVESAGAEYNAARTWAKESGLSVAVVVQKQAKAEPAKKTEALSVMNEETLLVKYLKEKEQISSPALLKEFVQMAKSI